jgi:hypothetical protein
MDLMADRAFEPRKEPTIGAANFATFIIEDPKPGWDLGCLADFDFLVLACFAFFGGPGFNSTHTRGEKSSSLKR